MLNVTFKKIFNYLLFIAFFSSALWQSTEETSKVQCWWQELGFSCVTHPHSERPAVWPVGLILRPYGQMPSTQPAVSVSPNQQVRSCPLPVWDCLLFDSCHTQLGTNGWWGHNAVLTVDQWGYPRHFWGSGWTPVLYDSFLQQMTKGDNSPESYNSTREHNSICFYFG